MNPIVTELTDTDIGVIASVVWPIVETSGNPEVDRAARWHAHQSVADWLRGNLPGGVFWDVSMSMIAVRGVRDAVFVPGDRVSVIAGEAFREEGA